MPAYSALEQALELIDRPELAQVVRVQPLPAGVLMVIRIAANDAEAIAEAVEHTGRNAEFVRDAAVAYVHQALFAAKGGPARTLGLYPDAPFETQRTHAHTLLKWLHPDATHDAWASTFAEQVTSAWDTLKRDRGRSSRPKGARSRSASRPTTSNGRPRLFRTAPRRHRRSAADAKIPRLKIDPPRLGAVAAVLVGCCLIGYQIVATAMAENLARTDPEAALGWQGGHPGAKAAAARLMLISDDRSRIATAEAYLESTIAESAITPGAATSLALAAEARGDQDTARALMIEAGRLSRRDTAAQLRLFVREAAAGNFGAALDHVDALLRTGSGLRGSLQPALLEFAMADDARPALLEKLAEDPPWRPGLLGAVGRIENGDLVARELMLDLREAGTELRPDEQALVINRMVAAGHAQIAFLTWSALLPGEIRASIPYVFNGDFERDPTDVLFDWAISPITGAVTEIVDAGGDRGRAMRIAFADRRVPYRHLEKVLLLSPGTYRLTGLVRAEDLRTEHGLAWRVACLDDSGAQLGETPPAKGDFSWREMSLDVNVPPGCSAQRLRLELVTRARLDQQVHGVIWFDDLRITRIPSGSTSASAGGSGR